MLVVITTPFWSPRKYALMSDNWGNGKGCRAVRAAGAQTRRQIGAKHASDTLKSDIAGKSPPPLLLLLTATPHTGRGGRREGGHGGTLPPVKHAVEMGGADREEVSDSVEAEQAAQWKWVIG